VFERGEARGGEIVQQSQRSTEKGQFYSRSLDI
jgi:hypothetical protein